MAKSYKVSIFAGTKVVADMAQQVKNATIEASIQLKTVKGGASSATATILSPGPAGANRKMEDVEGWFVNGTSASPPVATGAPWEAPSGKKNTNWWDGNIWGLAGSVSYPRGANGTNGKTSEKFNANREGGYSIGDTVFDQGKGFELIQNAAKGESPTTNPEKFSDLGLKDQSKVLNNDNTTKNLFDGNIISGYFIHGSNTPTAQANSFITAPQKVDELTLYIIANTSNDIYDQVIYSDIKGGFLARVSGATTTGALSPKGSAFVQFTGVYNNASLMSVQAQYIVLAKKTRPAPFYKQNPALIAETANPISGYFDLKKPPFNSFVPKKRLNYFNWKEVSKALFLDNNSAIQKQFTTGRGRLSGWIKVKPNTFYTTNKPIPGFGFFDENQNPVYSSWSSTIKTHLSPATAEWMRCNARNYNIDVEGEDDYRYIQIVEGTTIGAYHEYDEFTVPSASETSNIVKFNENKEDGYVSGNQFVFTDDVLYEVKPETTVLTGESPITNPEKFTPIMNTSIGELNNFRKEIKDYFGMQIAGELNTSWELVDGTGSLSFISNMCFHENHAILNGKRVRKVVLWGTIAGTITILKCRNVNKVGYAEEIATVINIILGFNIIDVDITLASNETLGFGRSTDTGRVRYLTGSGVGTGGRILIKNYETGAFQYTGNTLSIALYFSIAKTNSTLITDLSAGILKLKDRIVSIISDSIGTYEGYIPEGNLTYYPNVSSGVTDVEQCWWKLLLRKTGGILGTNNSWSGSRVSNTGSGSLQTRLNGVTSTTQILLLNIGTNDFGNNVPLGNLSFTEPYDTSTFSGAFCNALKTLSANYPTTRIIVITPFMRGDKGFPSVNSLGLTMNEYINRQIEICRTFGIDVIDSRGIGINNVNFALYSFDLVHFNPKGMEIVANYIVSKI